MVEQLGGGAEAATPDLPIFAEPARGPLWQLGVLWRFTRPHTLIGSALCIPALLAFAAPPGALFSAPLGYALLWALVPSLLINVYITGLNQLYDIELDRVNKPTLPLANGDMSPAVGTAIVLASLVGGLALGWAHPRYCTDALRATLVGSALLGTAYSAPPLRLKRFPLLAGLCIMGVRHAHVHVACALHVHCVCTACALHVHCVCLQHEEQPLVHELLSQKEAGGGAATRRTHSREQRSAHRHQRWRRARRRRGRLGQQVLPHPLSEHAVRQPALRLQLVSPTADARHEARPRVSARAQQLLQLQLRGCRGCRGCRGREVSLGIEVLVGERV